MGLENRFRPRPTYTRIEGLSSTLRLPRLGKVRLGIKVKKREIDKRCTHDAEGSCFYCTFPRDTDHFIVPPEVAEVYGDQPTELDILVPCEDQSMFFPQSLKCYKGNRLFCKGNGKEATRIDFDTGAMFELPCPCEHYTGVTPDGKPFKKDCSERANLMVLLPKVSMGGAYQIDTGSVQNIIELNSTVEWLRGMIGRIAFVPLKLKRVPTQMQVTEQGGKVRTTTKALLKLTFEGNIEDIAALRSADIISIEGGGRPVAMLPPSPVEDGEDRSPGAIVVEEEPFPEEELPPASEQYPVDAAPPEGGGSPPPSPSDNIGEEDTLFDDEEKQEKVSPDIATITAFIMGAEYGSVAITRYKEMVRENNALTNEQKIDLQDVLNKRLKELKRKG